VPQRTPSGIAAFEFLAFAEVGRPFEFHLAGRFHVLAEMNTQFVLKAELIVDFDVASCDKFEKAVNELRML